MAKIIDTLWKHNLAKVVIVDVTDDYRLMPPLPSDLYPVLKETYLPKYKLMESLPNSELVSGYLYDWHESPPLDGDCWYIGVVDAKLANELLGGGAVVVQPTGIIQA